MSVSSLAARLPDVPTLRAWSQSMAVLDAVLSPEWDVRYFSFDARWAEGEQLASMRNGSGDEYSFTFTPAGTYGRGFDHESELSAFLRRPPRVWPGLLEPVPDVLRPAADEPAFTMGDVPSVTVALWRLDGAAAWSHGVPVDADLPDGDDGGTWLFDELDGNPRTYAAFALEYYDRTLDLAAVQHVFAHRPLTDDVVRTLNADVTLADVAADLQAIGYPPA